MWIKRLLQGCIVIHEEAISIYCDNRSCIAIAKNPVMHGRTKHIDVKYHFIKRLIAN